MLYSVQQVLIYIMRGQPRGPAVRAYALRTGVTARRPCQLYETCPPTWSPRCGFRDFFTARTASRRDAYPSSSTHLPRGDLWHPVVGLCFRHPEDIYSTETELATELGYVLTSSLCASTDIVGR
jgi:hypothetical protein